MLMIIWRHNHSKHKWCLGVWTFRQEARNRCVFTSLICSPCSYALFYYQTLRCYSHYVGQMTENTRALNSPASLKVSVKEGKEKVLQVKLECDPWGEGTLQGRRSLFRGIVTAGHRKCHPSREDVHLGPWCLTVTAQHSQQLAGVHALLLSHLLHIKAHMHEKLDDVHLLSCGLVSNSRARRVAVGPWAAVNQVHGATLGRGLVVSAVVMETAVPAVQSSWKRCSLHLNVDPVAATDIRGRCCSRNLHFQTR